jgi:predicted nucleic acid-binding protein
MTIAAPRVYLDANVFIAAFEHSGARSDHAWWIINAVESGEIVGATSEITLAEVLVKPIELGDAPLAEGYERMISPTPGFEVLPVQRDILIGAAQLRARRSSLRLPDAIHLATARALSCSFVVSNDLRWPIIDDIKTLSLSPFTLDDIFGDRA